MPYGLRGADNATLEVFGGKLRVKDRGLDCRKIAEWKTYHNPSTGFTIQHENKAVVHILFDSDYAFITTDATTAIADGSVIGQRLKIIVTSTSNVIVANFTVKNNANTKLLGDWVRVLLGASVIPSWLDLVWDGSNWQQNNTNDGMPTAISGVNAHAEGILTIASGTTSHAEGADTTAGGTTTHAQGSSTTASGDYSHAQGLQSIASLYGQFAQAAGRFAANGDAQFTRTVLRNNSSDTNWKELFINGFNVRWTLADNHSYACMVTITARMSSGGAEGAIFTRRLLIERTAGTVTMRSGPSSTWGDYNPGGAYNIQITADNVNKNLKIEVKHDDGVSAKNVRWVAVVEAVEIGY